MSTDHGRNVAAGLVDVRSTALTHLVGDSRAYLQQLDLTARELHEVREPDLGVVVDAVARARAAVQEAERLGCQRLRAC
jgi:hypothetical protein